MKNSFRCLILALFCVGLVSCGTATRAPETSLDISPAPLTDAGEPRMFHLNSISGSTNEAPDDTYVILHFDRTVDMQAMLHALQITPQVALREYADYGMDNEKFVTGDFEENTDYKISLPAGYVDPVAGQMIGTASYSFHVAKFRPVIRLARTGEASLAPGHGLQIQLAHLAAARLTVVPLVDAEISSALELAEKFAANEGQQTDPAHPVERDFWWWFPSAWKARAHVQMLEGVVDRTATRKHDVDVLADSPARFSLVLVDDPTTPRVRRYVVVQRAEIGIVFKVGSESGLVWVTDVRTGEPIAAADVAVAVAGIAQPTFRGRTDVNGLLRLPSSERLFGPRVAPQHHSTDDEVDGEDSREQDPRLYAFVTAGTRRAFASWGGSSWQPGVPSGSPSLHQGQRITVSLERGVYRPGEKGHVFGAIRDMLENGHARAARGDVMLKVENADGDVIATKKVSLSAFGTFQTEFEIADGAPLGSYHVEARGSHCGAYQYFDVAEYHAPSFEVTSQPTAPAGNALPVHLSARYFYGSPVREGHGTFSAYASPSYPTVPGFERYSFASDDDASEELLSSQEFTLNHEGSVDITQSLAAADALIAKGSQRVSIRVDATVRNHEEETATAHISPEKLYGRSPVMVGISNERWVVDAAHGWNFDAVVVDDDGHLTAGKEVTLTLERRHSVFTPRDEAGHKQDYGWHVENTQVATHVFTSGTNAQHVHFDLPQSGEYRVTAALGEGFGNASATVWATGNEIWAGETDGTSQLNLHADKTAYEPGETAHILAENPYAHATALVTTERNGIETARVMKLDGAGTPIDFALTKEHLPNVFLNVALVPIGLGENLPVKGAPFRAGSISLAVSPAERRLAVTLTPEFEKRMPGEEAVVNVTVKGADGKPVQGEVTLWAVDEAVLRYTGYETPDFFTPIYRQSYLGVGMAASVANWTANLADDGNEGGPGDAGGEQGNALRSHFLTTAYFTARGVQTGAAGTAQIHFALPDNLTRWRIMASVADRAERFGKAETAITVSKPLQITPSLPRFFTRGDVATIGVVLNDEMATDGEATVDLEAEGATIDGDHQKRVALAHGSQLVVPFTVRATTLGAITFRARVSKGAERDGFELSVPVIAPTEWLDTTLGNGLVNGRATADVRAPAGVEPSASALYVTVSPSPLAEFEGALDALVQYPYGCAEQKTSALIAMINLEALAPSLPASPLRKPINDTKLSEAVTALYAHQRDDGGFALWADASSNSDAWVTAFVLWGLETAATHGYRVDQHRVENAVAYLESSRENNTNKSVFGDYDQIRSDPFAAFVIAEGVSKRVPGFSGGEVIADRLAGLIDHLGPYESALAAVALLDLKKSATAALSRLHTFITMDHANAVLTTPPHEHGWWTNDHPTVLSAAIYAFSKAHDPLADQLVDALIHERAHDGTWGYTFNNMWALSALSAYVKEHRANHFPISGRVMFGDRELGIFSFANGTALSQMIVFGNELAPNAAARAITITAPAGSGVHYNVRLHYALDMSHAHRDSAHVTMKRVVTDAMTGNEVTQFHVGQVLRIKVDVTADADIRELAVTDPLPAAFEAIDTHFATEINTNDASDDAWFWSNRELRDNRVSFMSDMFTHGERQLEYLVRVTRAGHFVRPASHAEAMYQDDIFYHGDTTWLDVAP